MIRQGLVGRGKGVPLTESPIAPYRSVQIAGSSLSLDKRGLRVSVVLGGVQPLDHILLLAKVAAPQAALSGALVTG